MASRMAGVRVTHEARESPNTTKAAYREARQRTRDGGAEEPLRYVRTYTVYARAMANVVGGTGAVRRARRTDPHRRDRIIDAAIDVVADRGVAGTTVRLIAREADVPLGSLTYHFDGLDELFLLAFERVAERGSVAFADVLAGHTDDPAEGVAQIIESLLAGEARDLVLMVELYSLALRRPEYRVLTQRWMDASRASLTEHFPADLAPFVDVFIEGATLHAALSTQPYDVAGMRAAIRRLTEGAGNDGSLSGRVDKPSR